MTINTKYLSELNRKYQASASARREIAELAARAQHLAKQAIFAAQRGAMSESETLLAEARSLLLQGRKVARHVQDAEQQGSYRAALEEFVEARLFWEFLEHGKVTKITLVPVPLETYLAALSDMVGELARYGVRQATSGDKISVQELAQAAEVIVAELARMNLTGYLRTKFDQARQHLRRLEDIKYDLSLRRHD